MMLRTLRAFAWMRWRVLMNSLERTGARDTVERLSLAIEQIGPWIALGLLVPSGIALAALGGYAGYWIATGTSRVLTFDALRILLVLASALSIFGPLMMPSIERTMAIRLLLLPIPRRTLYAAQAATAVSDPWVLLALPILAAIPLGLALGGALVAAGIAAIAAVLFTIVLVGLSALSTLLLHLIVRDRRRGELIALIFIIILPTLGMLPGVLGAQRSPEERLERRRARAERRVRDAERLPGWMSQAGSYGSWVLPSELFAGSTRASARGESQDAVLPLLVLTAFGVTLHGLGLLTFGRLLDSPASTAHRPARASAGPWNVRLPGFTRGSTAVTQAQVRLALRTPRGRSIVLSPLLVFTMFAIMMRRTGGGMELGVVQLASGLGLATFGSGVCLLSILPFALNQFAIDRAGLTLALLSPLDTRELLTGKAAGNAIIAGVPALLCVAIAYALFPAGAASLWLSLPPALLATYLLAAPGAAALSAIFPRAVDLNSIGRSSNAHGAAGLIGLLMFALAAVPSVLLALTAIALLKRPALTPVLLGAWCGVTFILSRLMFTIVAAVFERRRENLGMIVT
jgi:hypothetical protein